MPQFKSKPVVVEATQWHTGDAPILGSGGFFRIPSDDEKKAIGECGYLINTSEGAMAVCDGDWIVTWANGQKYLRKPGIFAKTYEPALLDGQTVTKEFSLSCIPGVGDCMRITVGCEALKLNRAFVTRMIEWLRHWTETGHLPEFSDKDTQYAVP